MISRLIDWCIHNKALVLLMTALLVAGGIWSGVPHQGGCHPGPVGRAGDHPDRVARAERKTIDKQMTYPLASAMMGLPRAKVVRGYIMFGHFVYVIFEDGTDIYWAHSRVMEPLNSWRASCRRASSGS